MAEGITPYPVRVHNGRHGRLPRQVCVACPVRAIEHRPAVGRATLRHAVLQSSPFYRVLKYVNACNVVV